VTQPDRRPGEGRVRLFVALELPQKMRDALVSWGREALSEQGGVRLLTSDHLHVTLCFLGWQAEEALEPIVAACRSAAGSRAGSLTPDEAIWLPPRRPRVLAVRLVEEEKEGRVVELQSRLSQLLEAGGWYVPERRPYLPHVTVARVGARTAMRPVAVPSPPPLSFPARRITLFRSRLSPGGARYQGLASVELG
jgi:2'-5' RNA ligase